MLRAYLGVTSWSEGGKEIAGTAAREAAYTMSDPADLVNVVIEELIRCRYELPAFSVLDRLVGSVRERVHVRLYDQVQASLGQDEADFLDDLLHVRPGEQLSDFNRLKQTPGPTTQRNMHRWSERLAWLDGLLDQLDLKTINALNSAFSTFFRAVFGGANDRT